jgi:hypothetical protein
MGMQQCRGRTRIERCHIDAKLVEIEQIAKLAFAAPQRGHVIGRWIDSGLRCSGRLLGAFGNPLGHKASDRVRSQHGRKTRSGGRCPSTKVLMLMMTFSPMSMRPFHGG